MKYILLVFFVTFSQLVFAQSVPVPSKMEFAGIKIHFNSSARKRVQQEVDKIRKSPTYFQKHVDQANLYFPLIEEVFKKKGFPLDFKYLIIQESAFNADAVSSSNAVGYWQFKEGTAKEVGLKVEGGIDERKNIYAATEGAANYIAKTNKKLDNWIYALLSYNVGPGGVMSYYHEKDKGATTMEVTSKMHWYVIKMLAHKIAFQDDLGKDATGMSLFADFGYGGKNLKQISKTSTGDLATLEKYNRWISKNQKIPTDKEYAVIFLMKRDSYSPVNQSEVVASESNTGNDGDLVPFELEEFKPPFDPQKNIKLEINHIPVITAKEGDYSGRLAIKMDITKKKFYKYNEISVADPLIPGIPYFTQKKKSKAIIAFYTVKPGENLWMISQIYGVTMFSIRTKNRMTDLEPVVPGRVLYLRQVRPEWVPVEIKGIVEKDNSLIVEKVKTLDSLAGNIPSEAIEPKQESIQEEVILESVVEEEVIEKEVVEAAIPVTVEVETINTENKVHVVSSGETFYSISKKYGVSVDELKKANNASDLNLTIGQELQIPVVEKQKNKELIHTVQKGDTMYSIARKYEVGVQDLMKWNGKQTTDLTLGENLKIIQN